MINKVKFYIKNNEKSILVAKDLEIELKKYNFKIVNKNYNLAISIGGDGLLISTSTDSTAYNMSFGGSIIYNTLKTLQITSIAPLNNKAYKTLTNSVVVPSDKIISLIPRENKNLFLMIDGENLEFDDVLKVVTKIDKKTIKCLRMNNFNFIKVINSKILEK